MRVSHFIAGLLAASGAFLAQPAAAQIQLLASDPLLVASFHGDAQTARRLLVGGKSPNTSDNDYRTALMWAAISGRTEVIGTILEFKPRLELADSLGNTALYYAAERGDAEAVEVLLQAGAPANAQNRQGETPLIAAARKGAQQAVQALLLAKANARQADYTGKTALDWARDGRSPGVIRLLETAR